MTTMLVWRGRPARVLVTPSEPDIGEPRGNAVAFAVGWSRACLERKREAPKSDGRSALTSNCARGGRPSCRPSFFLRLRMVQLVAADVEDPVPARTIIFKSDVRAQLHQLLFGKMLAQPRIQIIGNIDRRARHRVRQFNYQPLNIGEDAEVVTGHRL